MVPPVQHVVSVHCHNIAGQWIETLRQCDTTARIFSPYVTSGLAERAIASDSPGNIEVYTRFHIEAFACGASSLKTLRRLLEAGHPLFDVQRLHAKVFESPNGFATVGSQNLTQRGTRNRETTVAIRDPKILEKLKRQLDRWVALRRAITIEMIEEAELAIEDMVSAFRKLQRRCAQIEKDISSAQTERDEAERIAAEKAERERQQAEQAARGEAEAARRLEKEAEERLRKDKIASSVQALNERVLLTPYKEERARRLSLLGDGVTVPRRICYMIATSAMDWEMGGRIMPAPGDANHLHPGRYGLEINRGGNSANRFGVELAIKWCRDKLALYFPENQRRIEGISEAELRELTSVVRQAIIGANNKPYFNSYRPEEQHRIRLGNHFLVPRRTAIAIVKLAEFPIASSPS
jgi:uncharacterized protein YqfA (UPF0365 family)